MLLRLVQAAVARGWHVTALVPAGRLDGELEQAGAEVRTIPVLRLSAGSRLQALLTLAVATARTRRVARRAVDQDDVVLVNGLLALPATIFPRGRAPVVWWVHDVVVRRDRLLLARVLLPGVHLLVGVSSAVLRPFADGRRRTAVLRNGVDVVVPGLVPAASERSRTVGCVAALTPWKGQHVLLEAAARLLRMSEWTCSGPPSRRTQVTRRP
jgi:glycosyltransferase involved in cell wall biosynthesis